MELLQIEYFLTVARTENMTAAANSLHVAQSSVSRCISRLEESLGVPLFERSGRGIVLSDYGREFYKRAETIMRELSDGERQLKEMRDQQFGRVSIGTSVRVKDLDENETYEYAIVGANEADPAVDKISNESPVGAGLLGAKKNQTVTIMVPAGTIRYKVLAIKKM